MTNQLSELLEMANRKMNFFMIKECAQSIGFELSSMSMPSLKIELSELIANSEFNDEAESFKVSF